MPPGPGDADRLRTLYGIDWTAVGPRADGLAAAAEVMAPDVQARISPEIGDRVLHGVRDFAIFVEGLEEDFAEFRYEAETIEDFMALGHVMTATEPGVFLVSGQIRARGRRSKMPLGGPFSHSWTFNDGRAVSVEARMTAG